MRIRDRIPSLGRHLAALLILSACVTGGSGEEPGDGAADRTSSSPLTAGRPNILVIVTDDQRVDTMAAMPKTRRWMRDGGVEYVNAFVTTPSCCPSRASIFTGRMVHNHGVTHTMKQGARSFDQETTIQSYLQRAGYRTAIFGKYLNDWPLEDDPPYFDRWSVFSRAREGYSGVAWNVDGTVTTVENYSTSYVLGLAEGFLREMEAEDDRPWLMFVTPFAPHYPYTPEPRYREAPIPHWEGNPAVSEEDRRDKPPYVRRQDRGLEEASRIRAGQLRTLLSVDNLVDRLFTVLDELEGGSDTLAIFLSDNGYLWGEHGRTRKFVPYTSSIRVPMLLRWTSVAPPGLRDRRLVANIDVAPTILDAVGLDPAGPPMDGRSLLGAHARHRLVLEYWATSLVPSWASTRTKRFQYVETYDDDGNLAFREYYDLADDPWQLENLLARGSSHGGLDVERLSARLARDRACRGTGSPDGCP